MPLRALLNGQDFYANDLTKENKNQKYFCPFCKENFTPVLPHSYIIKHFRHPDGIHDHFSEPETLTHLKMKQRLYTAALNLGLLPEIEVKIGSHISDLRFSHKNLPDLKIAIECQCSSITIEEFDQRNDVYVHNQHIPLWVFGGNHTKRITEKVNHERGYEIQRCARLHRYILKKHYNKYVNDLYFYKNNLFFKVDEFQKRASALVLGWYHWKYIPFQQVIANTIVQAETSPYFYDFENIPVQLLGGNKR